MALPTLGRPKRETLLLLLGLLLLRLSFDDLGSTLYVEAQPGCSNPYTISDPTFIGITLAAGIYDCFVFDLSTVPSPWDLEPAGDLPASLPNNLKHLYGNGVTLLRSGGLVDLISPPYSLTFHDITFQFDVGSTILFGGGGGGSITFDRCNFYDHHSTVDESIIGGSTSLYFNDCIIKGNSAGTTPITSVNTIEFVRCSLIDNSGGAFNTASAYGDLKLIDSFVTNSHGNGNFELRSETSELLIQQSTIYQVESCIGQGTTVSIIQSTLYHPTSPTNCGDSITTQITTKIYSSILSTKQAGGTEIFSATDNGGSTDGLNLLTGNVILQTFTTGLVGTVVLKSALQLNCSMASVTRYCVLDGCSPAVNRGTDAVNRINYPLTADIAGNLRLSAWVSSMTTPEGQDIVDTGSYELQFMPPLMTTPGPLYVPQSSVTTVYDILFLYSSINCASSSSISLVISVSGGTLEVNFPSPMLISSSVTLLSDIATFNSAFSVVQYHSTNLDGLIYFQINTTNGLVSSSVNMIVLSASPSMTPDPSSTVTISATTTTSSSLTPSSSSTSDPSSSVFSSIPPKASITATSSLSPTSSVSESSTATANITSTPTPTPTSSSSSSDGTKDVECTDADECTQQVTNNLESKGVSTCDDITKSCGSNPDCFESSSAGATSNCKPAADYTIKLTKSSANRDQQLTIVSTRGVTLAQVTIEKGAFKPGVTISVRWIPSPTEKPEVESQDCNNEEKTQRNEAEYGSSGIVEVTARDKNGKKITNLDKKITIALPVLKRTSKTCVGYQNSKSAPFKCDKKQAMKVDSGDRIEWQSQEFDHLTSFAVFFQYGNGSGCDDTQVFWIISIAFLGAIPIVMAFSVWLITRFRVGRVLFFGEHEGMSVKQVVKALERSQREGSDE
eukprot:TRINITY_DN4048_c0_g1_i1.p1 TRINITY_DN4048_c0_g1~~TRINITY_DN4048_c0_g1_i1.p1  ORF type:complete len:902 (+),score=139.28 TRINITY_DN4048_c0_g1_i1:52-2757(+)